MDFRDTPEEDVQKTFDHAGTALEHLRAIDGVLRTAVGVVQAPNLSELEKSLSAIQDLVAPYVKSAARPGDSPTLGGAEKGPAGSNGTGPISSREDVLRVLVQIRSFYSKHEPASPIPLLIHRIERMVPMTFLEILQELAPDSIKEVNNIVGSQE